MMDNTIEKIYGWDESLQQVVPFKPLDLALKEYLEISKRGLNSKASWSRDELIEIYEDRVRTTTKSGKPISKYHLINRILKFREKEYIVNYFKLVRKVTEMRNLSIVDKE
jgi:hypothetical protein